MAGGASSEEDELITAINVTPLVDIVLVLLIVLMVTSSYLVNKAINVDLPKAATGETTAPTMSISIDLEGKIYLDGATIDEEHLQRRVRAAYSRDPEVKAVISADGRVKHAQVVTVIDILRREKVTKFAINTSPLEDAAGAKSPSP
jgi:biopolymer transport protein ExbD